MQVHESKLHDWSSDSFVIAMFQEAAIEETNPDLHPFCQGSQQLGPRFSPAVEKDWKKHETEQGDMEACPSSGLSLGYDWGS